jgi:hypothetical protein
MIRFNDDVTVNSPSCRHFIGPLLKIKAYGVRVRDIIFCHEGEEK